MNRDGSARQDAGDYLMQSLGNYDSLWPSLGAVTMGSVASAMYEQEGNGQCRMRRSTLS